MQSPALKLCGSIVLITTSHCASVMPPNSKQLSTALRSIATTCRSSSRSSSALESGASSSASGRASSSASSRASSSTSSGLGGPLGAVVMSTTDDERLPLTAAIVFSADTAARRALPGRCCGLNEGCLNEPSWILSSIDF